MPEIWDYLGNKNILTGVGTTAAGGYIVTAVPPPMKKYAGLIPAVGTLVTVYGIYQVSKTEGERKKGIRPTKEDIENARKLNRSLPHLVCFRIKRYMSWFREFADLTFRYSEEAFSQVGGFHFHINEEDCEGIINVKLNGRTPQHFYLNKVQGYWVLEIYDAPPNSTITFSLNLPELFYTAPTAMYRAWTARENYALDCEGIIESFRCPEVGECDSMCYGLHTPGTSGDLLNCPGVPIKIPVALFKKPETYEIEQIDQGACR